ncbi:MAG: polysaccharide biosynthesis tyrosine autokinase [Verrucomicrobia bacterium]|jgi:capsular exopolysaccharide synthesis family protein|nr:polysaccharide biosynthesis tyrosine autokinase [Verrucomicrobiota bacterium]
MESTNTAATTQQESRLHFLDYWRIIRIRKTVILAVFLLVVTTATLVTFILPEAFASTARIKIEREGSDIQEMTGMPTVSSYDPYFIQTEFEVIQSQKILDRVIEGMDLNRVWGDRYAGGQQLKSDETLRILQGQINLKPVRNTSLIEIEVFSENPDEAANLANAIAVAYRDYRLEKSRELALGGIKELEKQWEELNRRVNDAQAQVDSLREKLGVVDPFAMGTVSGGSIDVQMVQQIQGQIIMLEGEHARQKAEIENLKTLDQEQLRDAIQTVAGADQELSGWISDWGLAEQRLIALQKDYTPENPVYLNAQQMANDLQERIDSRIKGILNGLATRMSATQASIDTLRSQLEDLKTLDAQKATASRPYYQAKRDLETIIRMRDIVEVRIAQEKIDVSLPKTSMVQIVDDAVPRLKAVKPNKVLNIILGVVVGLVVGVGLAFFIEYLDTSVKTIDDVERSLGCPVLGIIPQDVGIMAVDGPESPNAEAYRVLRTNLLFSRKDDRLNTVCVVSAGAGEGKSTTLLNLATIFAQAGDRVLVIDSDLRRPTLHKILGLSNSTGLTSYLLKQNALEEVILRTKLPTLDFMPSGKLPSSSMGILSSTQMQALIGEVKQRYDYVFLDSPPIMGVSDASILASEVDLALQVIQYRRYPQPMNVRAKQMIEKVGGNLVGIVLNNINLSQAAGYYSDYYQSYYYQSDESAEQPAAKTGEDSQPEIKSKF